MAKLGIKPVNQVRFLWFGAEEAGLVGSAYYVSQLTKRELKGTAVMLNFDMIGSPNAGWFVYEATPRIPRPPARPARAWWRM
jgi:Zn-dependent M28 family amino/carboxypeptidase